jgi:hypothetical protein
VIGTDSAHRRRWARRIVVVAFVSLQIGLVVRAYWAPHREFGYQMFPEASTWQADIVRVTDDGRRLSIEEPWFGYEWPQLVRTRGLSRPWIEHHADSGVESQLTFLHEALDWVASNTPDDVETRYLEATIRTSRNTGPTNTTIMRSTERVLP